MNEKIQHSLIILVVAVLAFIIVIGIVSYATFEVAFVEHHVYYDRELNLTQIAQELERNNISFQHGAYGIADSSLMNEYIQCKFGERSNGISLHDTLCYIYRNNTFEREDVSLRLYDKDGKSAFSVETKRFLENSTEYITNIIYNATGQHPARYRFYYEDGPALKYQENIMGKFIDEERLNNG